MSETSNPQKPELNISVPNYQSYNIESLLLKILPKILQNMGKFTSELVFSQKKDSFVGDKIKNLITNQGVSIVFKEALEIYLCYNFKEEARYPETKSGMLYIPLSPDEKYRMDFCPKFKKIAITKKFLLKTGCKINICFDLENETFYGVHYQNENEGFEISELEIYKIKR